MAEHTPTPDDKLMIAALRGMDGFFFQTVASRLESLAVQHDALVAIVERFIGWCEQPSGTTAGVNLIELRNAARAALAGVKE